MTRLQQLLAGDILAPVAVPPSHAAATGRGAGGDRPGCHPCPVHGDQPRAAWGHSTRGRRGCGGDASERARVDSTGRAPPLFPRRPVRGVGGWRGVDRGAGGGGGGGGWGRSGGAGRRPAAGGVRPLGGRARDRAPARRAAVRRHGCTCALASSCSQPGVSSSPRVRFSPSQCLGARCAHGLHPPGGAGPAEEHACPAPHGRAASARACGLRLPPWPGGPVGTDGTRGWGRGRGPCFGPGP